ncbi:hypothetical protein [Methylobacterium gnaphalii]|uniref:Uncharacterized protein n=1 Tax=Methylobacterium gnaphalii TaxID=1010610 RepID=A0A512JE01_9HYPH|nr:hypothetical protein [Methylobacterium gnaphalii]GEP08184.1 hypothetical protein MGN01_00290 [Methylobacterium gnaphalii]GJD68219.1 hypothetical protein MMMDOFMJ_1138 [Methylobacterium gnaphalii]GLS51185.1 hypothetical protein GCM10007885_40390 [Methylobacterium gnaphalii]
MTKAQCIETLRGLIARSDRTELAQAQAAIIEFALASPDLDRRSEAMSDLQATLAAEAQAAGLEPMQAAYHSVLGAMIDRTRDAVISLPAKP